MRSFFAASIFLATSIALTGCSVDVDRDEEQAGDSAETAGALSAYGNKLVGAYRTANAASDFDVLVLKADGTYFAEEHVVCITAPCNPIVRTGKFIGYRPAPGGYLGGLRLNPKGAGPSIYYRVSLGSANESFKLSRDGKTFYLYETTKSGTYCSAASDCKGQSYIHPLCVGFETCNSLTNSCGWKCGTPTPACDYSGTTKSYVGKSTTECSLIKFYCVPGTQYFADSCGCGCEPVKTEPCYVGGCSGQVCSDREGVITTCEFRPEYACYAKSTCERNAAGACAWKVTPELTKCLANPGTAE